MQGLRRLFCAICMILILMLALTHLGVSISILVKFNNYGDVYRPEIGLACFNIVIGTFGLLVGGFGLFSVLTDRGILSKVVAFASIVIAVFALASLITALVIHSLSIDYVTNRFTNHMNNYNTDQGSKDIINRIQTGYVCCGTNTWLDWSRLSLNGTGNSTGTTTTATTTTAPGQVSTTTVALVGNTTTAPGQVSATTAARVGNTTTAAGQVSTTTVALVGNTTTAAGQVSTTTAARVGNTTTAAGQVSTTTAARVGNTTTAAGQVSTTTAARVGNTTTAAGQVSTTTAARVGNTTTAPGQVSNTTKATGRSVRNIEAFVDTDKSISDEKNVDLALFSNGMKIADKNLLLSDIITHDLKFKRSLSQQTVRRRRQAQTNYGGIYGLPSSFSVTLPQSCCTTDGSSLSNLSNSYCISNSNNALSSLHSDGCSKQIGKRSIQQTIALAVINSFLVVVGFVSVAALFQKDPYKIPSQDGSIHQPASQYQQYYPQDYYSQQYYQQQYYQQHYAQPRYHAKVLKFGMPYGYYNLTYWDYY